MEKATLVAFTAAVAGEATPASTIIIWADYGTDFRFGDLVESTDLPTPPRVGLWIWVVDKEGEAVGWARPEQKELNIIVRGWMRPTATRLMGDTLDPAFHQAWAQAKESPEYDKTTWIALQREIEGLQRFKRVIAEHVEWGWAVYDEDTAEGVEALLSTEEKANGYRDKVFEGDALEDVAVLPMLFFAGDDARGHVIGTKDLAALGVCDRLVERERRQQLREVLGEHERLRRNVPVDSIGDEPRARATPIRFIGFGRMGLSFQLVARVASDSDSRKCIDGHEGTTVIRVAQSGSMMLCDEPRCASCMDFRTIAHLTDDTAEEGR